MKGFNWQTPRSFRREKTQILFESQVVENIGSLFGAFRRIRYSGHDVYSAIFVIRFSTQNLRHAALQLAMSLVQLQLHYSWGLSLRCTTRWRSGVQRSSVSCVGVRSPHGVKESRTEAGLGTQTPRTRQKGKETARGSDLIRLRHQEEESGVPKATTTSGNGDDGSGLGRVWEQREQQSPTIRGWKDQRRDKCAMAGRPEK